MSLVYFWTIIFSISAALSIALLGDRNLISGNLLSLSGLLNLIFNWKFIVSMSLALLSRFSFVLINNSLLKIPNLAQNSTTITAFITAISFIFVAIANYFLLKERIDIQQGMGAALILLGIWLMLK